MNEPRRWSTNKMPAMSRESLGLDKMERFEFLPSFECYHANSQTLYTPTQWEHKRQRKVIFLCRDDGDVFATCMYCLHDDGSKWRFYNWVIDTFGHSDETMLMITADFPTDTRGLVDLEKPFCLQGGLFFMALRHPEDQSRVFFLMYAEAHIVNLLRMR